MTQTSFLSLEMRGQDFNTLFLVSKLSML